jgi:mRNA interferase HigB
MRVIKPSTIKGFAVARKDAAEALMKWLGVTEAAEWMNLADVRQDFPAADGVRVASNRVVTVFNICGNRYRLLTAIHYNTAKVFVLDFLTHADYSKDRWKATL